MSTRRTFVWQAASLSVSLGKLGSSGYGQGQRIQSTGDFEIEYKEPFVAGQLTQVTLTYTLGEGELFTTRSRLRIGIPNCGWEQPRTPVPYFWPENQKGKYHTFTPYDRVNTTVQLRASHPGALADITAQAMMRQGGDYPNSRIYNFRRWWITVSLNEGELRAGDSIRILYGDPVEEPPGIIVQRFPEDRVCFLGYLDLEGSGHYVDLRRSPWWVKVISGRAARLDAFAPTVLLPGEQGSIKAALTDSVHCRPTPDQKAQIEVRGRRVVETGLGFEASLNPSVVRDQGPRVYWGEFHSHSMYHGWNSAEKLGISCGTPQECYAYAREVSCLDFVSITDSSSMQQDIWEVAQEAALEADKPGRFVVFQGTESGNDEGHRNVIFRGHKPEPRLPSDPKPLPTSQLQRIMKGRTDVLLIPHHTKIWTNWDIFDAKLSPVMEICSTWGVFEKLGLEHWNKRQRRGTGAQEAWRRGYRLGVVGGTDNHTGTPGRILRDSQRMEFMGHFGGLAAVWAPELTRETIFDGVKRRHCYATTGARMLIEFNLGTAAMGSEVPWMSADRPRIFRINIIGTAPLQEVVLVKNNEALATFRPGREDFEEQSADNMPARSGDFYYLRVTQLDGHMAWASPIWVDMK